MQVFVPFSTPFECAMNLDSRRLNKQVIECRQILAAIRGESNAWRNHPCVKMYADHTEWLECYMFCLECAQQGYREDDTEDINECFEIAEEWSRKAELITPDFLTEEFCIQHRRRLYTKDNYIYERFAKYGESDENWYVVNGDLWRYVNGKRIN